MTIHVPMCYHNDSNKVKITISVEDKTTHPLITQVIGRDIWLCMSCRENLIENLRLTIIPDPVELQREDEYV